MVEQHAQVLSLPKTFVAVAIVLCLSHPMAMHMVITVNALDGTHVVMLLHAQSWLAKPKDILHSFHSGPLLLVPRLVTAT
jgi:hypothetical protein